MVVAVIVAAAGVTLIVSGVLRREKVSPQEAELWLLRHWGRGW
jgi:hypothetical protein